MSKVRFDDIMDAIKKKVYTPERFHSELLDMIDEGQADSLIEAIGIFCEENQLEGNDIVHLVDETLKGKLKLEAEKVNILKSKTAQLPF